MITSKFSHIISAIIARNISVTEKIAILTRSNMHDIFKQNAKKLFNVKKLNRI